MKTFLSIDSLLIRFYKLESDLRDFISNSSCVVCGKFYKDFDKEKNNCCNECWEIERLKNKQL